MTLETSKKLYKHIFRLLKVHEILVPIGKTNKGNLGVVFRDGSDDFEIMLDSVPLSVKDTLADENNIELKRMLEKYLFDETGVQFYAGDQMKGFHGLEAIVDNSTTYANVDKIVDAAGNDVTDKMLGKKRGRPAGSKNGKKAN